MLVRDTGWHGPSAAGINIICIVKSDGYVGFNGNTLGDFYSNTWYSARPVVSIPRIKVDINIDLSGTTPVLWLVKK